MRKTLFLIALLLTASVLTPLLVRHYRSPAHDSARESPSVSPRTAGADPLANLSDADIEAIARGYLEHLGELPPSGGGKTLFVSDDAYTRAALGWEPLTDQREHGSSEIQFAGSPRPRFVTRYGDFLAPSPVTLTQEAENWPGDLTNTRSTPERIADFDVYFKEIDNHRLVASFYTGQQDPQGRRIVATVSGASKSDLVDFIKSLEFAR